MSDLMLINIPELVTCASHGPKCGKAMKDVGIIEHAYVVIKKGIIHELGHMADYDEDQLTDFLGEIVDCSNQGVIPGFIDSHTHFVFGGYRAEEFRKRLEGVAYMTIMKEGGGIASSVKATREANEKELYDKGLLRLDAMLKMGVTTVEGKSGYGLDLCNEVKQLKVMKDLNERHLVEVVPTFLGLHSLPEMYKGDADRFVEEMMHHVLPRVVDENLAEFADVFCEKDVFSVEQCRRFLLAAKQYGLKVKVHADEIVSLGGTELAAELGAVSADHLLASSQVGIKALAEKGVVATLLPATAFSLKEGYADVRKMIEAGCAVALASDFNPGSCPTHSIPLIIALAAVEMGMTIEEIINALTINAAAAIDKSDMIGSIEVGKQADILILSQPSINYLPYHFGMNLVERVIKKGQFVIG